LGRKSNGTIWSWGFNGNGQLGIGSTLTGSVPAQIGTAQNWRKIEAGSGYAFAINNNNELFGWGYNSQGQLGTGTTLQQLTCSQIGIENNWKDISAACGAVNAGTVYGSHSLGFKLISNTICATGSNYISQLGNDLGNQSVEFNCVTGDLTTGVNTNNLTNFVIFPNPSTGKFSVQLNDFNEGKEAKFTLLNSAGQILFTQFDNKTITTFDLSQLEKGIYFIEVCIENNNSTQRIIIE
jgi:alpha-tubulin suppressor-like RCC1 family protein